MNTSTLRANPTMHRTRDTIRRWTSLAEALYGAQTERARQNFPISDLRFPWRSIQAIGLHQKKRRAHVNLELGLLMLPKGDCGIIRRLVRVGCKLDQHFLPRYFKPGSGTHQ